MAKQLTVHDVVKAIQNSLPMNALALAYFTREQEYSYYTFQTITDFMKFFAAISPSYIGLEKKDPNCISFLIDEWFIFASSEIAKSTMEKIREVYPDDDSSE